MRFLGGKKANALLIRYYHRLIHECIINMKHIVESRESIEINEFLRRKVEAKVKMASIRSIVIAPVHCVLCIE
jgi:hypothetical protein